MNKKILIISILAAVLVIMLPISSVVGTNIVKSDKEKSVRSPLFAVRHQSENKISSEYLGKGNTLSLFIEQRMTYARSFDKAVSMLKRNPVFFNKILDRIQTHPKILEILEENDISMTDFESYANAIKNNPVLLDQEIKKIEQYLPEDSPLTLGFNSTNPLAIIILIIVFLPIIITIGLLIATITIITCLNINGCFEKLITVMFIAFAQGLTQPDT